ncbi:hypothetical protein WR25_00290 [Diploscapter pachys]|uniref:RNA polymerase II subunit B1 CTD phosphatase RPAP2 homolog n=1 Tax=Diploscapter pachys TaxID=2018661 RepID=A0A2A2LMV9_9BILA|nr:hypothetical protein WR25_00290 [Diploscapter pachys]
MDAEQLKEKIERERVLRKTVLTVIERFTDTVSVEEMLQTVSNLDVVSWDEVIEERDIGGLCGLPVCSNNARPKTNQKYHIDRKVKKIYEVRNERYRFCSDNCFEHSASVRSQLADQPLWIRGEAIKTKISFNWTQQGPSVPIVKEGKEKKEENRKREVEIVGSKLMAKMNELVIAERDGASSEEEDEEKSYEDKEFLQSIKRFVSQRESAAGTSQNAVNERGTGKKADGMQKNETDKEAALAKLREKYPMKKKAVGITIIDAPRLTQKQARETVHSDIPADPGEEHMQ